MKRFLITAMLLILASLLLVGCDIKNPFAPEGTSGVTTTAKTPTGAETTTAASTTAATTAATTTAAPLPWLLDEPLADYITLPAEAYTNAALKLPSMPEPTNADVEAYILNARKTNTLLTVDGPIALGDTAEILYHGEANIGTADAPVWVEFLGGSNFGDDTAHSLVIGSNSFIPGFESALIGIDPKNTAILTAREVVYISASITYTDATGTEKTVAWQDRVDLTKDGALYSGVSRYSDALRNALCTLAVGDYVNAAEGGRAVFSESFDVTGDLVAEAVTLSDVLVTKKQSESSFMIEVPFPASYPNNTALAGKNARWHIIVKQVKRPTLADLDYSLVSTKMGITYKMLTALVGEDAILTEAEIAEIGNDTAKREAAVMAHYKEYILRAMQASRENSIKEALWEAFAAHIIEAVVVKGYPEAQLADCAASFRADAKAQYEQYMANYGYNIFSFEEYVMAYYGKDYFPDEDSIDEGFCEMAKTELRYEMAIYYMADALGLGIAKEEREAFADEEMRQLIEYYNKTYGTGYTEEDMIKAGINDRVLIENAYFNRVKAHITEALRDLVIFEDAE